MQEQASPKRVRMNLTSNKISSQESEASSESFYDSELEMQKPRAERKKWQTAFYGDLRPNKTEIQEGEGEIRETATPIKLPEETKKADDTTEKEDRTLAEKLQKSLMIKVGVKNKAKNDDEEEPLSMTMLEKKFFLSSMLGAITLYVAYEYILEKKSD